MPGESQRSRSNNRPSQGEYPDQSVIGAPQSGSCEFISVICSSEYFASWTKPDYGKCGTIVKDIYPLPDPRCTPGGIDPSVTVEVLRNARWRTRCIRNCETSEAEKSVTYDWYNIMKPRDNRGENQVCELDHLVPLELGGADGLGNIWPECGPSGAPLSGRNFKIKDRVENYLADEVKAGRIPLGAAQHGIAVDWTQYLEDANRYCESGGRCGRMRK
jgi:hypothetical protein